METFIDQINFYSSEPYYSQLKRILLHQIEHGIWAVGDELPSHAELCERYQVSKTVVRQALKELEMDGRIIQRRGKIASVAGPKITGHLLQKLTGTYADISELGYYPVVRILNKSIENAGEKIASRLMVAPGTPLINIERLRYISDTPFELVTSYLIYSMCPTIMEMDLTNKSLLAILSTEFGIEIGYSKRSIEATIARDDEARLLQVSKGAPLLLFNSVSYNNNGVAIGTTRALFRGDLARFDVEIGQISNRH